MHHAAMLEDVHRAGVSRRFSLLQRAVGAEKDRPQADLSCIRTFSVPNPAKQEERQNRRGR